MDAGGEDMKNRGSAVYLATHQDGRQGVQEQGPRGAHEQGHRDWYRRADHRPSTEAVPGAAPPRPRAGRRADGARTWRFTLPVGDVSVPSARRTVRDLLGCASLPEDLLHSALLVVSELVTNAVRHAALLSREIGVLVRLDAHRLQIAVEDGHPYRPDYWPNAPADVPGHEHVGGRGLLLVAHLAAEAGGGCETERTPTGGKVVRVTLPLPAGR